VAADRNRKPVIIEFPDAGFEAVVLFTGIPEDLAEPAG
jgi:uncharacterized membrane protein